MQKDMSNHQSFINETDMPVISIITVVFNAAVQLELTINSIIDQTYKNIEYIIIDGKSTDQTIEIIQKYQSQISHWITEADTGIYDAMNKGLKIAHGEYIHILNAGDSYVSSDSLESIARLITIEKPKFISSTVNYKFDSGRINCLSMSGDVDTICHPGLVVRADLYKNNLFNENIRYAADIEFFLRVVKRDDVYVSNEQFVLMPAGGVGGGKKCLHETIKIYLTYGKLIRAIYVFAKLLKIYAKTTLQNLKF